MNEHEKIAAEIFKRYKLNFNTTTRGRGWTNAVWLNGDLALRLSLIKDNDRIRREVRLSEMLPVEVGYPQNIATGITDGYEWSLSKRIQGKNLSDVWNDLDWSERFKAIKQILDITNVVHSVDIDKIGALSKKTAWYSAFNITESLYSIEQYVNQKIFTTRQGQVLYKILERFYDMHNTVAPVLNHGDITMDNLIWFEGNIVSLIDFEHSIIAPPELDLHSLVNLSFITENENILTVCDKKEILQYKHDVMELFKPSLLRPGCGDLLLGYSVLFRQRFLEFWLENPEGKLEQSDAYVKLLSLSDGQGGYLSSILGFCH